MFIASFVIGVKLKFVDAFQTGQPPDEVTELTQIPRNYVVDTLTAKGARYSEHLL
jgi:hypothetical protein